MLNTEIKKYVLPLIYKLDETILEETEWRLLTDVASYNIDTYEELIFLFRTTKENVSYPVICFKNNSCFSWTEHGWESFNMDEEEKVLEDVIIFSNENYLKNKEEKLYTNFYTTFKDFNLKDRESLFPLSCKLNEKIEGFLDDKILPKNQNPEINEVENLDQHYLFKTYFEEWKIQEYNNFEKKWRDVYIKLNEEGFLILKEELLDKLTVNKKGLQKRYILTKSLPFTIHDGDVELTTYSYFVEAKNLQTECGPYYNEEMLKKKEVSFKSKYNNLYFRIIDDLLFSTESMAYSIWKYEGVISENQKELFKLVEQE